MIFTSPDFPFLDDLAFIQFWPGLIDATRDLLPIIIRPPDQPHLHFVLGSVGLPWAAFSGSFAARNVTAKQNGGGWRSIGNIFCSPRRPRQATVFLGSALLFLAMLFAAAAITGAVILVASSADPNEMINSPTFRCARATGYIFMNVYAIKMAAVFMISTSTVVIYTDIAPRWIAILGYVLACVLLVGSYYINLSFFVLPLWVCLVSIYILLDNLRRQPKAFLRAPSLGARE